MSKYKPGTVIRDIDDDVRYFIVKEYDTYYTCLNLEYCKPEGISKHWIYRYEVIKDNIDISKIIEFLQNGEIK